MDYPSENSMNSTIEADLILIHAPSVFDFRERDDILFAYLSDSDSVNVTSIYEMYPLGFLSIKQWLSEHGYRVKIINLASLMLMYPELDVIHLLSQISAPVIGLDLHWMAHCHGSIEVAKKIKVIHPEVLTVFGGISATYFAGELIQYDAVDVVVKGYDTLIPLLELMNCVRDRNRNFSGIPNLVYKDDQDNIIQTEFSYKPNNYYNDVSIDWSYYQDIKPHPKASKLIFTLPNTGCAMDCGWCGGSRFAFQGIMKTDQSLVYKDNHKILNELKTLGKMARNTSIYALQCYLETRERLYAYLDGVKQAGVKSVSFELFHLPDETMVKKMVNATQTYIMLSPESHDRSISKLAGRGNYSMKEMEDWMAKAFDAGIYGVVVWFFIGMPGQTRTSVVDTVAYCEKLLNRFRGQNVIPVICPMVPFLDPGSRFYEAPKRYGYHLFYTTLAEHRAALEKPIWYQRLNYHTDWMTRKEIQDITYEAIRKLVTIKGELGVLPLEVCYAINRNIDETCFLLSEIEHGLALDGVIPITLRDEIRNYNRRILSFSSDQLVPVQRPIGNRWFDDYTVPPHMLMNKQ